MLCEQVLGKLHDFDITGKTIEYVDIEWHEAFKKIHKKTTRQRKTESGESAWMILFSPEVCIRMM